MCYVDPELARAVMDTRIKEARRQAQRHQLLREAGIVRQGWLSGQRAWLLRQLGRQLVALGQRLEERSLPQTSF